MPFQELIAPNNVHDVIRRHNIGDGFDMVMDLNKSHGSYLYDSKHDRELLDFFGHIATIPLGYNHPKMLGDESFKEALFEAALANPVNSDVYTQHYANFMATLERVAMPDYLPHAFFIAGGSLAVENALKTAMDWKVQKNFQKGYRREVGHKVMHFDHAFHGRSGYTLSLTNTDPGKTKYFAKFDWPRISSPMVHFPLTPDRLADQEAREALAIEQIKRAVHEEGDDICALILENIQSEGGDNHFREEFLIRLRELADEHEFLLIHDEVQVGMGATGQIWSHENFSEKARPDIVAFGKKMQVCGILCGRRVEEVEHNVFNVPSRINSTWGGNLVDMVRADKIMQIIEEDNLLDNVRSSGGYLLEHLEALQAEFPPLNNARGRGVICSIDLPTGHQRNEFIQRGRHKNVLFLGCGEKSIRFRPALTIGKDDIDKGVAAMKEILHEMGLDHSPNGH